MGARSLFGVVTGLLWGLALLGCGGEGRSRGPDAFEGQADVLAPDGTAPVGGDGRASGSDGFDSDAVVGWPGTDTGWVGVPSFCYSGDYDHQADCTTEFFNGICGLNEAKRLLQEGLCPPPDRSVIREGERLILGGDPLNKTTLPPGAECPTGFERLPRITTPDPGSWFQPTCWGVGYATRVPEPAILEGKYLLSGLDAFSLGDPGAFWAQPFDYLNNIGKGGFEGDAWDDYYISNYLDQLWPDVALGAHPPPTIVDGKMQVCAAKDGPWVDMEKREVVAQFGGFFTEVGIDNFQTANGCVIPWLIVETYCCGPILMLWPEDIAELRSDPALAEECVRRRELLEQSPHCGGEGRRPEDCGWLQRVVAPRTRGLEWMGWKAEEDWIGVSDPDTCANSPTCQVCTAYNGNLEECEWKIDPYEDPEAYSQCLLSAGPYILAVPWGGFALELDENYHPISIVKSYSENCRYVKDSYDGAIQCDHWTVSVPYRTPDEVAKDIPPP